MFLLFRLEDSYKASSVMCRDFLENLVKGYMLGLGSCCDQHPTFESDIKAPVNESTG